jgi:hypothetical protein
VHHLLVLVTTALDRRPKVDGADPVCAWAVHATLAFCDPLSKNMAIRSGLLSSATPAFRPPAGRVL